MKLRKSDHLLLKTKTTLTTAQTEKRSQGTLENTLTKSMDTFSSNTPVGLEEEKCAKVVTIFETRISVLNRTRYSRYYNIYKIHKPEYWANHATIEKLN